MKVVSFGVPLGSQLVIMKDLGSQLVNNPFFKVLRIKLFLTSASNIDSPKAYGPSSSEAMYADLTTAAASISEHTKSNRYALFKRSSKQRRVIYTCDRARKPQTKAKNPNIHESKRQERSRNKKCDCQIKIALKLDQIT